VSNRQPKGLSVVGYSLVGWKPFSKRETELNGFWSNQFPICGFSCILYVERSRRQVKKETVSRIPNGTASLRTTKKIGIFYFYFVKNTASVTGFSEQSHLLHWREKMSKMFVACMWS
jgi:hypothetical protein